MEKFKDKVEKKVEEMTNQDSSKIKEDALKGWLIIIGMVLIGAGIHLLII